MKTKRFELKVVYLDFRQDGQDRSPDTQQHVDAYEDFVLGTAIRVSVIHIEQNQWHQRQSVIDGGGGQESYESWKKRVLLVTFGSSLCKIKQKSNSLLTYLHTSSENFPPPSSPPRTRSRSGRSRSGAPAGWGWNRTLQTYLRKTRLKESRQIIRSLQIKWKEHLLTAR